MKKIGITGQNGFVGKHLYNTLGLHPDKFERVPFDRAWFEDTERMDAFTRECDVIVHLAGMNRHGSPEVILETNVQLADRLADSMARTASKAHIIFSSSTQEERDNHYGRSKLAARERLLDQATKNGTIFTGLVIPNVFGPFGHPFYNSVVATFCHQLTHQEEPKIDNDGELHLIYVGELVAVIIDAIGGSTHAPAMRVAHSATARVSRILSLLQLYRDEYMLKGAIPAFADAFERNLFNTFRSYMDIPDHFPVKFTQHTDPRGSFVEVMRASGGGQTSFSTTHPGITRGNHFHTRKIERFAVLRGEALIQLRRIGTDEVIEFRLNGNEPAYVDMPVWYTHNISNVGQEELLTVFWINEFFDPADPDTYMVTV
ncbi:NAD-dependent epimerase/dehydratase family protein [Chitinophaga caseinilytica]|uniref:polysaccharide biosynthesis C-terminal domain-containing protein n=1 Tax=Chitinophaga caseinilytica TaxID=2267521 RepID=UPI003C2AE9C7